VKEEKKHRADESDDTAIEIVDIDTLDIPARKSTPHAPQHFSPKQRRAQLLATVGVIVLVLALLLGGNGAVRRRILSTVVPPTPTATAPIALGTDNFYVESTVGWGQLFIDTKPIAHLPNMQNDAPIRLARGTHTLLWKSPPFQPMFCTVSVPNNYPTDTCKYDSIVTNPHGMGWKISFALTLDSLSPTYRDALTTLVQATIDTYTTTDIIQKGGVYVTDDMGSGQAVASEPLKVTTRYELRTDVLPHVFCGPFAFMGGGIGCIINQQNCHLFCSSNNSYAGVSQDIRFWDVFSVVRDIREYTTMSGTVVLQHQIDVLRPNNAYEHVVPLKILWHGTQWHVTLNLAENAASPTSYILPPAVCDKAQNAVEQEPALRVIPEPANFSVSTSAGWNYTAIQTFATSCLGIVTLAQPGSSQAHQIPAYCLYRLGVFLAANDIAHKYWPNMPLANAQERQLAQQLATAYQTGLTN